MTKREARLYYRKLRQGVKRYLTNNYKKTHGERMLRAGTLFEYQKKRKYCKRTVVLKG